MDGTLAAQLLGQLPIMHQPMCPMPLSPQLLLECQRWLRILTDMAMQLRSLLVLHHMGLPHTDTGHLHLLPPQPELHTLLMLLTESLMEGTTALPSELLPQLNLLSTASRHLWLEAKLVPLHWMPPMAALTESIMDKTLQLQHPSHTMHLQHMPPMRMQHGLLMLPTG